MDKIKPEKINWQTSVTLDAIRLSAALMVFFHHGYGMWFDDILTKQFIYIGHFCVIIFFVLSGYLIAYTTINNNRGIVYYAQARLSRLYSVLLPAVLITAACHAIIYVTNPVFYSQNTKSAIVFRYILSTFFLSETWFNSAAPSINAPLWSMSFEFWYYTIFGAWFFLKSSWKSYLLLIAAIIIAGPAIIAMMPVWLMGCLVFKLPELKIAYWKACLVFAFLFVAAILLMHNLPSLPFELGQKPFFYANEFLKDTVVGFFVALSLWFITSAKNTKKPPANLKVFRKIADLTFPLYLLHYPLLMFWRSLFPLSTGNTLQFLAAMISILTIISIIGFYLENKRNWWSKLFGFLLKELKNIYFNLFKNRKTEYVLSNKN